MMHRVARLGTVALALTVGAPPAAAQRDRPQDILALRGLLVAHHFVRLDSALSARRLQARGAPANEIRYVYAYDAFSLADSTLRPHLDTWVARRPASSYARLARGTFFGAMAGDARGGAWAKDTKDSQFEQMHVWIKLALSDAAEAGRLDSTDIIVVAIPLQVLRLAGREEAERDVLARALVREPTTLTLRIQHMGALRPRWFGSEEEMEIFAGTAQEYASQNPRLRVLLGFSAFDRAEELYDDDQHEAALVAYTKALSYGDFWRYRQSRGRLYYSMNQPEKALIDLNRALAERPGVAETLGWRAVTYIALAELREGAASEALLRRAAEDLRLATALDPTEYIVAWARENYPELLRATASALPPGAR